MDGQGPRSPADVHVDSFTAKAHGHVPDGAFVVPDPNLIFNGEFKRTGLDLVLSHEGHEFVVHDYFRGDKRAALASPDGAHLTGDVVNALTGHVQVAQAAPGAAAAQVIGHVTKLVGSATAVRNGVSVILNNGDNVEKGDVVSTGADSTLGITFIDGTVFGLSSNARMVLNEMVYDPNGSSNSSLLSLVAGTITFVAGETAKHGDMKIDTPVATMGIRGTAVLTQINFVVPAGGGDPQPQASFQVLVEPNGTTGSYILFDKVTLLPIATVNQAGQMIQISGGNVSISNALMSPDVQKLITDVFTLKFTDNNTNTKLTTNFTDTLTPIGQEVVFKTASGAVATATFVNLNPQGSETPSTPPPSPGRIPGQPIVQSFDASGNVKVAFALTERAGTTGDAHSDTISGLIRFVDQNLGDLPTVSISLAEAPNFAYKDAGQHDVTGSLTDLQKHDIAATQIQIKVVPDAGNDNNGSAVWTYTIPDNVFDFLAAGETLTLTYMVRVDTNFVVSPESKFIPITITITGTNDKPVITTDAPIITFEGGTSVPGGPLTTEVPTSGTLNFTDVDLTDKHTVSVALTSATLPGGTVPPGPLAAFQSAMSVAIAAGADSTGDGSGTINWSLADLPVYLADFIPKGAVLTLLFTVTLTDSQGATSQQTITVTITGTDAPAVVWIATDKPGVPSGGFWRDAGNWATGTVPTSTDDVIVITDQLHGLTPSYPVTIDVAAFAKSLTLDDYDTTPGHKVPEVINKSTLTIGGKLTLNADAKFTNSLGGHVIVGGAIDVETITRQSGPPVANTSTITNAGTLTLQAGGTIDTLTAIANSGTIDLSGGTLVLKSDVENTGGTIRADAGAALIVDGATVDGGTVAVLGTLELDGTSRIENGALNNSGTVNVKGTVGFADETVDNASSGLIEVLANGWLTIQGSGVTNAGHITIDAGGRLTVNDATIAGAGTVTGNSEIELTGGAVLSGGVLTNNATFEVSGIGNALHGETITNAGTIEVLTNGALTIDQGSTVANAGNVIVDAAGKLTVDDASIGGAGTVTGNGEIDLTGNAVLSGGILNNNATLEVSSTGNALENETVTNAGTIEVAAGGALAITQGATVDNSIGNVIVDANAALTLNDATITGGAITGAGAIDITGNAVIDGHAVLSTSAVTVEAGTMLTVDDVTVDGTTISDNGSLTLDGIVKLTGGAVIKGQQTSGSPVTARFDWGQLGTSYILLGSPLQVVATNGTGGTVSSAGGTFELRDQGNGWYGNFAPETHLLWDRGAGPDITVQFAAPVYSAGAQIQADYFGSFTAEIIAYDLTGNVIGSVSRNGVSTSSADNSAIFIELTGSSADIAKVKFHLTSVTYSPNDFAIGPVIFAEATGGGSGPIVNNGTLEISGPATLLNDVVTNHGTVTVDDGQTLTLSNTEISGGAIGGIGTIDVTGDSAIDGGATLNTSFVTIESGATLALDDVIVSGTSIADSGILKVNVGKKLTLNGVSVTGGQLNVLGTLASSGASTVTNASVTNSGLIEAIGGVLTLAATTSAAIANAGTLRANGAELAIDHQAVTNTGTLAAINDGTLKLTAMTVTNTGGTVSVASGSTLNLAGATINGGTVTIAGTLESTGTSAVDGADLDNTGTITVTSGTLTIDPGLLHAITNLGLIEAAGGGILKLATATIANAGGTIAVDSASKLYLTDVSINGGTLSNAGHLYGLSGSSTITGAVTNTGTIEVQAGTLNLAGGITGVGTLLVDDGAKLELGGADAQTVTFAGGVNTLKLDATSHDFTGTITGKASTGGTFTVTGDGDINSSLGDALDFTASGGTSGNRANIVLTPTGALTGAANGLVVTQNGAGDISLTATKDLTGGAGNGITLRHSATGSGDITVNNLTGKATGTGANSAGVLVENLNGGNSGDISIAQLGGAAGGAFGIDAGTLGNGDIDIDAGGAITGGSIYGIRTRSHGSGSQTVTTEAGSVVTSGSSGVVAVNRAISLDAAADSSITITNYGTINSGSSPNLAGNAPAGIEAGYTGAISGSFANTGVNGSVVVNNHGNITAAGGYGINAFNYGNGDVTVNSFAGTTISVSGSQSIGINAAALSGGTGDVTVTLGENVTISGATSYGIRAYSFDQGDISVTLANGDSVTSGSSGIVAVNFATAIAAGVGSTISVEARGTIQSGTTLNNDGTTPGAIVAGYKPDGNGTFSNAVNGDVVVNSDANITAAAGYGIEAFTWGIGDVTVTTGQNSHISAAGTAIGAFDHGGGDVSITNNGSVSGAVGVAALATDAGDVTIVNHGDIGSTSLAGISVTLNAAGATGSTHITNSGSIAAPTGHAAIYIQENATGTATIDNSGTIGPAVAANVTATTYAIVETGGAVEINNTGDINGNISVASATFNNKAGGTWTVAGTSIFGNVSSIVNHGDIGLKGASISGTGLSIENDGDIDSWGTASISGTIANTGNIEIHDGKLTLFGSLSGTGSVTVDAGALLKLEGTVTQTITLEDDGAGLQIDTATFGGSIAGLSANDTIDLSTIVYGPGTSAVYLANSDPSTGGVLTVSDSDGNHISLNLTGADYSHAHFAGSDDGTGHTLITINAVDDAPAFDMSSAALTANFSEREDTTGSSDQDPVPTATGSVDFTDIDLTDRPTATITHQATTWLAADHSTELTLTSGQAAALEQALAILGTGKNNGTVDWSYSIADSALDFLGEGQTATVVSTITLDDHRGQKITADVTVTITGTNDAPAVSYVTSDYMNFDGQTIAVGDVPTVASDGVTLDGWVNWNGGAAPDGQVLFYNGNTSTAGFGLIGTVVSGNLEIEILEGGVDILDTGFALTAGQWHNLAVTRDQGTFTLYVDGNAVYSHSGGVNAVGSGQDPSYMMIGAASDRYAPGFGAQGFTGSIADVSVWTTALTQAQVRSLDFTALTGNETNLAAYYQLGDGSGTTASNTVNPAKSLVIEGDADWASSTTGPGGAVADLIETNAGQLAHGVLALSDVDTTDHVIVSVNEVQVSLDGVTQTGGVGGLSHEALLNYLSVPSGDILDGTATHAQFSWQFNSAGQAFDFLAAGQTLSLQYTIVPSDAEGAGTSAIVTVNIAGSNDAPTLADLHIGPLADTAAADTFSDLTGTLTGNDADTGETATLTYAVLNADHHPAPTVAGLYGTLTVDSDGSYSYVPNAAAINALAEGSYADTFTVQTTDVHDATGTATLTVDVTGADDAPVIDVDQISVTQEGDQVFVHGVSVTDTDAAADETFTLTAAADSGTYVDPASTSDTLAGVNAALQGLSYTEPSQTAPATDVVAITVSDGHGASDTVNLIFNLSEQGLVTLASTDGKDVLFGTGYQDQFVFAANSNHDRILDFASGTDHIDLSAVVTTSDPQDWIDQHVAASGTDTLITLNAADTILLKGVTHVQASDFIFHA